VVDNVTMDNLPPPKTHTRYGGHKKDKSNPTLNVCATGLQPPASHKEIKKMEGITVPPTAISRILQRPLLHPRIGPEAPPTRLYIIQVDLLCRENMHHGSNNLLPRLRRPRHLPLPSTTLIVHSPRKKHLALEGIHNTAMLLHQHPSLRMNEFLARTNLLRPPVRIFIQEVDKPHLFLSQLRLQRFGCRPCRILRPRPRSQGTKIGKGRGQEIVTERSLRIPLTDVESET
jgi:hypothetical protein